MYVSDNLEYRIRSDIYADEDEVMESLFIEIICPHERNVIVGIIYCPPNQNVNDFVTRMNDVLGKISRDNKKCYLMGDFNLNLQFESIAIQYRIPSLLLKRFKT